MSEVEKNQAIYIIEKIGSKKAIPYLERILKKTEGALESRIESALLLIRSRKSG